MKEQIEKGDGPAANGMTQEPADLREIVFKQQQENAYEDAAGIKTVFRIA